MEEDQNTRQQAIFDIGKPVLEAQAQANIVTAHSAVATATRMANLRTQAAAVSPTANDEFIEANQLADFNAKADALAGLQAKYSWMSLVPEYKGFVDTLNHARAEAHLSALADMKLEEQMAQAQTAADTRIAAATIGANARTDVANTNAGARVDSANIAADSRTTVAATSAAGRLEAAKLKAQRDYELEVTVEKRDEALQKGDTERAQIYQDHINKMNTSTANAPDRALPTNVPVKPSVAPSPVIKLNTPKIPPKVSIDGNDYPVFKDKDGNVAYLKDGQYIPIEKPAE